MRDTDLDWAKVAVENPFWAVDAQERYLGADLSPSALREFFRGGERAVAAIFEVIDRYLVPNFAPARSLEFGCGVGRLLLPIARRSGEAIGTDVAPRMLELSRHFLAAANVGNARVVAVDDPLLQGEAVFDFINSFTVLQHIPPERGYAILHRLIRLLRPGGVAAVQFTYARAERLAIRAVARYARRTEAAAVVRADEFGEAQREGPILMFDYDLHQVFVLIKELGAEPVITYPTGDFNDHLGAHLYFRRPAA